MAVARPGDPVGPQKLVCLACATVKRAEHGEVLRDANGLPLRYCELCIGRITDRLCECTFCPWLEEP